MNLTVLSWAARGGGRAKALLSIADECATAGIHTTVVTGTGSWRFSELCEHHGITPDVDWQTVDWQTGKQKTAEQVVSRTCPDVVLAFDTLLIKCCRNIDPYTVGYLRTQAVPGVDEYWTPSKQCRDTFQSEVDSEVHAVYPIDYIEVGDNPSLENRPFDVLIHGRKVNDAISRLSGSYNILLANRFSYPELREIYSQTKLFLFPQKERFEPLGLMPMEAAAHGCQLALTENSGVSEAFPECSFETPSDRVERLLNDGERQGYELPESPTKIPRRIKNAYSTR